MDFKKVLSNFSVALASQAVVVLMSVVTSLMVPKMLGVEQFGYWQLFILYTSYVSLFRLGLNEGVYLIHGGKTRDEIDKRLVNSQMWVSMALQLVFAAAIVAAAFLLQLGPERSYVFCALAAFILLDCMFNFLGLLFQLMNETKLFSLSGIVNAGSFLVALVVLLALGVADFRLYVGFYCGTKVLALAFCLLKSKDFLAAGLYPIRRSLGESWASMRVGIKLTVANISASLIIGCVQFLIDFVWGIETFSEMSFALSMVNFFLMFLSQASMVLFPALRQVGQGEQKVFFLRACDALNLLLPAVYIFYAPAVLVLNWWLPQYAASFALFALLIPMAVFDGKMDIALATYLKVLRHERSLLIVNLATVALSFCGALVGAYVFNSVYAVIVAAVSAVMLRSLASELYLRRCMQLPQSPLSMASLLVTLIFLVATQLLGMWPACILYIAVYAAYLFLYRNTLRQVFQAMHGALR